MGLLQAPHTPNEEEDRVVVGGRLALDLFDVSVRVCGTLSCFIISYTAMINTEMFIRVVAYHSAIGLAIFSDEEGSAEWCPAHVAGKVLRMIGPTKCPRGGPRYDLVATVTGICTGLKTNIENRFRGKRESFGTCCSR
mgnify:CR=1 FL=1